MRRGLLMLASAIPRSAWDPDHHDKKWVDSYAKPLAKRRSWPAKKYLIQREPLTPSDWLSYSKRNMAYAYNAAMRAAATFPEMLEFYEEMKERQVLVDIDTAFILLSRAARYDKMRVEDLFLLADELKGLGARFDVTVIEVLQTVWEHASATAPDWREARRRELVDVYNELALRDISKYGPKGFDQLLLREIHRYARNLKALDAGLRYEVWAAVFAQIQDPRELVNQVCVMLRQRAPPDAETTVIRVGRTELIIPDFSVVARRLSDPDDANQRWAPSCLPAPPEEDPDGTFGPHRFEDVAINIAFLAAVARVADAGFYDTSKLSTDRALATQLLLVFWQSRVMLTSDVFAQLMDIIKFSAADAQRDSAARAILRRAVRGANSARTEQLSAWNAEMRPLDARVIARYIASVDPWSSQRFSFSRVASDQGGTKLSFEPFDVTSKLLTESSSSVAADSSPIAAEATKGAAFEKAEGAVVEGTPLELTTQAVPSASSSIKSKTSLDVDARVADIQRLIANTSRDVHPKHTHALAHTPTHLTPYFVRDGAQLFTGRALFLSNLIGDLGNDTGALAAAVKHLSQLKADIDGTFEFASAHNIQPFPDEESPLCEGPETETWEAMILSLNRVMDMLLVQARNSSVKETQARSEEAFQRAAKLRDIMLSESMMRYGGKFRALWLQEA